MIISDESPFRRIRDDLNSHQASFLDGIRICAEIVDLAYCRLANLLGVLSKDQSERIPVAALLLDAWAIVDSAHRLRHLLDGMPGLSKKSTTLKQFLSRTEAATTFRNTIQHLRQELQDMGEHGWPSWGSLGWIALVDAATGMVSSFAVISGRVQSGEQSILNPAGKTFLGPIDHVTLYCKADELSLSMIFDQTQRIICALEPGLTGLIADRATRASDLVLRVTSRLTKGERD